MLRVHVDHGHTARQVLSPQRHKEISCVLRDGVFTHESDAELVSQRLAGWIRRHSGVLAIGGLRIQRDICWYHRKLRSMLDGRWDRVDITVEGGILLCILAMNNEALTDVGRTHPSQLRCEVMEPHPSLTVRTFI